MSRWLKRLAYPWRSWRSIGLGVGVLTGMSVAFFCGRYVAPSQAKALPPVLNPRDNQPMPAPAPTPAQMDEYNSRPVAYVYDNLPITRRDLGEYLIAREGASKLEYLVNHRIIEMSCKEHGIYVTEADVNHALEEDLAGLKLNSVKEFEDKLLKQYRKTLYEWKEDVIWPKLALTRLARGRVQVTPEDMQACFEAWHGEKIDGRLIMWKAEERQNVIKNYANLRANDEEFNRVARMQVHPDLASRGGRLDKPIAHHTTGDEQFEKELFALRPGEVSSIHEKDGFLAVFKCDRRILADTNVRLEDVRGKLEKEIIDRKVQIEIVRVFNELKTNAHPMVLLKSSKTTEDELNRTTEQLLRPSTPSQGYGAIPRAN